MEKKKELDFEMLEVELIHNPKNVIKLFISPFPVQTAKKELCYNILAYRKGDSKYLGDMYIKVKDIIKK